MKKKYNRRVVSCSVVVVDKAKEYDVDELIEHVETMHNLEKATYNLRKH